MQGIATKHLTCADYLLLPIIRQGVEFLVDEVFA